MNIRTLRSVLLLFTLFAPSAASADVAELADSFRNPPASARPHTWWHWMNGRVTPEGITADLQWMQRVGIGGVQAFHIVDGFEPGDVGYLSPHWIDLFRHAASEADRLGLEICLHNCAGWSSSGGPWITPDMAMQEVVWSEIRVDSTSPTAVLRAPQPKARLGYYRDIAVLAFPTPAAEKDGKPIRLRDWEAKAGFQRVNRPERDPRSFAADQVVALDDVIDLTETMSEDGSIDWAPETGDWTIVRFGHTPTGQTNLPAPPEGRGLECDKLNPEAIELHWRHVVTPLMDSLGPLAGRVFTSVLIDSYEARHHNWTPGFEAEFQRRVGYGLRRWLPALTGRVVDSADLAERFLWDFRRVIGELTAEHYYGRFEQLCHEHGLKMAVEPYGHWGVFNDFSAARYGELPMGEFWTYRLNPWSTPTTKLAASAAHAYGRPIVGAESFTSGAGSAGWFNSPAALKALGDHYYCQGLNRVIFHTCVHQPWLRHKPGMTMWRWGMQMNRNNTLAEQFAPWLAYMARAQHLLQQGDFVADLCYLASENTPNSLTPREQLAPPPPAGYDYDAIDASNVRTMEVRDGSIALPSGMRYRALVLPNETRLRPYVLEEALRLAAAGATIVCSAWPEGSPSLESFPSCDESVRDLVARLKRHGNVELAESAQQLASLLNRRGIPPDVACRDAALGDDIEYVHRRTSDCDVYFVSNQRDARVRCRPVFRVDGRAPQLWRPETGEMKPAPVWRNLAGRGVQVDLDLAPAESVFVVFSAAPDDVDPIVEIARGDGPPLAAGVTPSPVHIESATYGSLSGDPDERIDVTDVIRHFARDGRCIVPVTNYLGKDPARNKPKELRVRYRVDGRVHEDVTAEGEHWRLAAPRTDSGPREIDIIAGPEGAQFVAYRSGDYALTRSGGASEPIEVDALPAPRSLDGPWNVDFHGLSDRRAERFNELQAWNVHDDNDIRYYSGAATYRIEFSLSEAECEAAMRRWLDFGELFALGSVRINGHEEVALWKPPFGLDVTRWTTPGVNTAEITVTNLWANQLIGDEQFAPDYEVDRDGSMAAPPKWLAEDLPRPSTKRRAVATYRHWSADDALLPSGLLGPVRLHFGRAVPIEGNRSKASD